MLDHINTIQIPGIPADAGGFPDLIFVRDYQYLGNGYKNGYDPQTYHNWVLSDDLSWVRGRHQLKFGGMFRRRVNILGCREPKRKFQLKELVAEFPQLRADTAGREVLESLHGHLKTYESAFCE